MAFKVWLSSHALRPDVLTLLQTGQNDRAETVRIPAMLVRPLSLTLDRYCVRPNSGMIPPNGFVEVQGKDPLLE